MVGILQSVASVVASGGFSLILKSVVLIGFVIIFLQMIITSFKVSPHRSLVKYFAAVLVIYSALLIPKVNVNVYDTVNNTGSNAVVVSNVPWGIGAIASYFSQFQYYMTTAIEKAFSTPQTIDLTNAGMGFALTSQNIVDGVQIDDPYLFQSFTQYVYNCVLPGISAGALSSQALTQAGMSTTGTGYATNSLLGYMASYTDGAGANLLTTEYSSSDPSGITTTCGVQTGDIETDFTNYATNEAGPQIAGALGMTYATFSNEYGLVNSSIYNMSSNAEDEIIQMMAVNQFNQAMIQSANLAGVNPSQLAYGSALAQQNMSDSFSISGQMAGKYMPVVYSIFSALFLAFSLFLIILMALPIGVNYLKMYMELGLFLAVWPALMAVYNYIMDLIIQQGFLSYAAQGYSLNSAHTVNTFIATQLGWMGYLSWGVPMMAYALVTGSTYAMVGAISSMDSAGKTASAKAAQQAASGSVNLGNDSLNNYGANKVNAVTDIATGQGLRTYQNGFDKRVTPLGGGRGFAESQQPGSDIAVSDGVTTNFQMNAVTGNLNSMLSTTAGEDVSDTNGKVLSLAKTDAAMYSRGNAALYNEANGANSNMSTSLKGIIDSGANKAINTGATLTDSSTSEASEVFKKMINLGGNIGWFKGSAGKEWAKKHGISSNKAYDIASVESTTMGTDIMGSKDLSAADSRQVTQSYGLNAQSAKTQGVQYTNALSSAIAARKVFNAVKSGSLGFSSNVLDSYATGHHYDLAQDDQLRDELDGSEGSAAQQGAEKRIFSWQLHHGRVGKEISQIRKNVGKATNNISVNGFKSLPTVTKQSGKAAVNKANAKNSGRVLAVNSANGKSFTNKYGQSPSITGTKATIAASQQYLKTDKPYVSKKMAEKSASDIEKQAAKINELKSQEKALLAKSAGVVPNSKAYKADNAKYKALQNDVKQAKIKEVRDAQAVSDYDNETPAQKAAAKRLKSLMGSKFTTINKARLKAQSGKKVVGIESKQDKKLPTGKTAARTAITGAAASAGLVKKVLPKQYPSDAGGVAPKTSPRPGDIDAKATPVKEPVNPADLKGGRNNPWTPDDLADPDPDINEFINSIEGPFEYIGGKSEAAEQGLLTYIEDTSGKAGELLDGAGELLGGVGESLSAASLAILPKPEVQMLKNGNNGFGSYDASSNNNT